MMTQQQKIITLMIRKQHKQAWFFPYEFMVNGLGELFVGYEASARLSELARNYPDMIESQRDGKYTKRRIRWETMNEWRPLLNYEFREIFSKEYKPAEQTQALF